MSKFKVDDRVKVVKIVPGGYGHEYIGKTDTVVDLYRWSGNIRYVLQDLPYEWHEEELTKVGDSMQKKVRLTKDMLLYKKSAVFQETADGDDYMLITSEHAKYPCYKVETKLIPKDAIEKNPKMFEEVYSASEMYFTKDELKQIKKLAK